MVGFARSEHIKALDKRWHEFRQRARETATSEEQFADVDRVRFDLDTARIDGKEFAGNFEYNRPIDILGENGTDVRELDDR